MQSLQLKQMRWKNMRKQLLIKAEQTIQASFLTL